DRTAPINESKVRVVVVLAERKHSFGRSLQRSRLVDHRSSVRRFLDQRAGGTRPVETARSQSMSATYGLGLIVGKFAPLHKGHVRLVEHAPSLCRRIVIMSYSSPELPGYDPALRESWLTACFPGATIFVVTPDKLAKWFPAGDAPSMPRNDASADSQREFVAT